MTNKIIRGNKTRDAKHYYLVGRELSRRKLSMFVVGTKERKKEWAAFEAEAVPLMADVFRVANYLGRDCETAEDFTQETFAEALKSFHYYTPDTYCRAWLVTIPYHLNSKRWRKLGS